VGNPGATWGSRGTIVGRSVKLTARVAMIPAISDRCGWPPDSAYCRALKQDIVANGESLVLIE
jgi:hypothetical protein